MPSPHKQNAPIANRLLAALPKQEYQRLLPELEQVTLLFAEVIYEPGATIRYVYFPNDAIICLLSVADERSTFEVGIVGNEGMVGLSPFMGVHISCYRALVQGAGTAVRMKAAVLQMESSQTGSLHRLLKRYTHSFLTQASQSAVCNRFHTVEARLARWLLMSHDRLRSNEFQLTQEFMSNMLGVRREGITRAAGILQRQHLISYRRGHMTILDRAGIEAVSCKCYRIIKPESDNSSPTFGISQSI